MSGRGIAPVAEGRRPWSTLAGTSLGVTVPPIVFVAAVIGLWGIAIGWIDVALIVTLYALTGLGISVGFHRLFTHRSFETTQGLRATWAILGSLTLQGPVIGWVTEHRKHHAYSDKEGDPHSPHVPHGAGRGRRLAALWHAHIGWFFTTKGEAAAERFAPDLLRDSALRRIDRMYPVWVAASFGIPFLVGLTIAGSLRGGAQALVWGGFVRILMFHHATWSVNSICHTFGDRPYLARDESRNNWVVGVLVFGEGWHNNHHAFPSSAVLGLDRHQLDVGALVLRGLERLGLVWGVNRPDESQRARRRREWSEPEPTEYPAPQPMRSGTPTAG